MLIGAAAAHGGPARASLRQPGGHGSASDNTGVSTETGPGPLLNGRVRDAAGDDMAGATLTLISPAGHQVGRAVAHSAGRYELTAPAAGSYVLIAAADGHQPQATTVVLHEEPLPHDVVLSGAGRLDGNVVSAGDGVPVESVMVMVTDVRGDVLASGMTDASGGFGFGELPAGDHTLTVNAPGFRPVALPVQLSGSGATTLEVPLRSGARLRGVVRAGAGRRALTDARVTLVDAAGNVVGTTTTGSDGAYSFTDLDAGSYSLITAGYPPVATTVTLHGQGLDNVHLELAHPDN
ncbi:carboxypeptidase regulatory-like domain-containing protein [Streptomyces sp. RCU064]|uniref:Carboxypeptidase regulatory-like domain-containing protein n=1 Tax=Streptomyces rugosispiralis TaxID=2967341 RepID=A0ABT1UPN8_9ACTN|nr:carboxypeptidase regulatory-like domain-containing protein [Streptomyces rugosispiralis]MCQ8187099.1 carboxypeptidase regulatory-like domain-containing protein [Streptomyces rugosispiralis]